MSTREVELLLALQQIMEFVDVPEANCSCHLSPPCGDCVDYGGIREAMESAKAVMGACAQPHAAATTQASTAQAEAACAWTLGDEENGIWQSSCGEAWSFVEGGPVENRVSFCHHCGKPVVIRSAGDTGSGE